MSSVELTHLLSKVEGIKKQLGGPVDDVGSKESDEFNAVKLRLAESINEVSKKQQERDDNFAKNGRTVGVIRNEVEIQDLFTELDLQLAQMKEVLRRQKKNPKKYPASTIEIKEQQYQKYNDLVRSIRGREDGETVDTLDKPITLTELKINLTGDRSKKPARIDVGRELNEIEEDALKRFKKNDEEMDKMLGDINQGLDGLRQKAEVMGDAIEGQKDQIHGMEIEINKAHEGLVTSNARLKKVLYQYRKPSKFCLDVILILLLLGLIAVIVKLATSGI